MLGRTTVRERGPGGGKVQRKQVTMEVQTEEVIFEGRMTYLLIFFVLLLEVKSMKAGTAHCFVCCCISRTEKCIPSTNIHEGHSQEHMKGTKRENALSPVLKSLNKLREWKRVAHINNVNSLTISYIPS